MATPTNLELMAKYQNAFVDASPHDQSRWIDRISGAWGGARIFYCPTCESMVYCGTTRVAYLRPWKSDVFRFNVPTVNEPK